MLCINSYALVYLHEWVLLQVGEIQCIDANQLLK